MDGYSQPMSESLGIPDDVAEQAKLWQPKRSIFDALLKASGVDSQRPSAQDAPSSRLPAGVPDDYAISENWGTNKPSYGRLVDRIFDDPGAATPEHPYSVNGNTRPVGSVQDRTEDDRTPHPEGQDPWRDLTEYRNSGVGQANPESDVAGARARLVDAMQPHGIESLRATAQNRFVRGLEKFGIDALKGVDLAGGMLAPHLDAAIPGSRLNELVRRHAAEQGLSTAIGDDLKESQAENYRSEAASRSAKPNLETTAAGRRQLAEQYGLEGEDKIRYILTGQMPVAADKPNLSEQVGQRAQLADQYGLQGADRQRYILTGQMPTEKPETGTQEDQQMENLKARQLRGEKLNPQEASALQAYNWRKTLGPQTTATASDVRQTRQQQFEIDKEARGQVNSAEKQYRQAKESADALGNFIDLATGGNKIAAATVPLEGTLEIVTSQGVKRINRTEVEGVEGAGSLFDRIQGKIGKWTKGQPIPPDLLQDFGALNDMLRRNAYQQYSDAYDQAHDMYGSYGTDFTKIKKLPAPLKQQIQRQGAGAAAGMVRFQDSQGNLHDIPKGNLEKARQRDPGLQVLGQ